MVKTFEVMWIIFIFIKSNHIKLRFYTVKAFGLVWISFYVMWIIFIFIKSNHIKLRFYTVKAFGLVWISFYPKQDPDLTVN
jgi:hypothetical protein